MEGCVITEELNIYKLEAGVICILKEQDKLELVTIQHLNPDSRWVVTGTTVDDYPVPADAELCKLVVINDKGVYPLKFNQWKKAIKNKEVGTDKQVSFELIPEVFKEGKYIATCGECTAHFLGGRNQSNCKDCCDKDVTARIIINKVIKPKRPRVKSVTELKALALTAYQMGTQVGSAQLDHSAFNTWLEKQF